MALFNLLSLLDDVSAFIYIDSQIFATIVPLLVLLIASRFRLVMVEFMMPATVLTRILATGFLSEDYTQL